MCANRLHFDGNSISSKDPNCELDRIVRLLRSTALARFHPSDQLQPVDRAPNSPLALRANKGYNTARKDFSERFEFEIESRTARIIYMTRFFGCDRQRVTFVPWKDPKTDIELLVHNLLHLDPGRFAALMPPHYDLAALDVVGAHKALLYGAQCVFRLINWELKADGRSDFSVFYLEALLRTLRVIDSYVPGCFGGNFPEISVSLDRPLVLTPLETAELGAFKRHLSQNGSPNVQLIYGVSSDPSAAVCL